MGHGRLDLVQVFKLELQARPDPQVRRDLQVHKGLQVLRGLQVCRGLKVCKGLQVLRPPRTTGTDRPMGPPGTSRSSGPSGSQVWQAFLFRLNSTYAASTFTPDTAIRVTRIQAEAVNPPNNCTTNAVISLSDGTPAGTGTLAITGAANDSGPIALNYSAGATSR